MRRLFRIRARFLALAVVLLVLFIGMEVGSPGNAEAQAFSFYGWLAQKAKCFLKSCPHTNAQSSIGAGKTHETHSCWVTGDFGGNDDGSWGENVDEFAVDMKDLGVGTSTLGPFFAHEITGTGTPGPHSSKNLPVGWDATDLEATNQWVIDNMRYTLFDSLPELVDYTFALDVYLTDTTYAYTSAWPELKPFSDYAIYDRRIRHLASELRGASYSDVSFPDMNKNLKGYGIEDPRLLLPEGWLNSAAYQNRRAVAFPKGKYLDKNEVSWINLGNPDGGSIEDSAALERDRVAGLVEVFEGTTIHSGGGGILHYGTTEGVGNQLVFQTDQNCANKGTCDGIINVTSNPVALTLQTNIRETNDGQIDEHVTGQGERTLRVVDSIDAYGNPVLRELDVPVDVGSVLPSTANLRGLGSDGYDQAWAEDTPENELEVTIEIPNSYRRDVEDYYLGLYELDKKNLPIMGYDPWTYDRFVKGSNSYRDLELDDWVREIPTNLTGTHFNHDGYRQPVLGRPTSYSEIPKTAMSSEAARHIRWPVNFEDMNWYLYRLPTGGYRSSLWIYWLTDSGTNLLVRSGYGIDPSPIPLDGNVPTPNTNIPGCTPDVPAEYADFPYLAPLNPDDAECVNLTAWDLTDLENGRQSGVHFPFYYGLGTGPIVDGTDQDLVLSRKLLVKQGTESPLDVAGQLGSRRMNKFSFSISETEKFGSGDPSLEGYDRERRLGIPSDLKRRNDALAGWPDEGLNPNDPYLMVITFYEAKLDDILYTSFFAGVDLTQQENTLEKFLLPHRQMRRVICRMIVYPDGFEPSKGLIGSVFKAGLDLAEDLKNELIDQLKGMVSRLLVSIGESPVHAGTGVAGLACGGLEKLDDLTSIENVSGPLPAGLVDGEGRIRVNSASESKGSGLERCRRISSPPAPTCQRDADFILQGNCERFPEMKLTVSSAEFIRPEMSPHLDSATSVPLDKKVNPNHGLGRPGYLEYSEYRHLVHEQYGEQESAQVISAVDENFNKPAFGPVAAAVTPANEINNRNRGLTRVFMDWDFRSEQVSPNIDRQIDGYTIFLYPDKKSLSYSIPADGIAFNLPKSFRHEIDDTSVGAGVDIFSSQSTGVSVGGLGFYPNASSIAKQYSTPLINFPYSYGDDTEHFALGPDVVNRNYNAFQSYINNMPLAPGFKHGFQVAPYQGVPGHHSFKQGPRSDILWLDGDKAACDYVTGPASDRDDIQRLYDCGDPSPVNLGYTDDEFRPGLLALTGTDICNDIFSSTPAGFTWDNPYVKQVWGLIWIIAGGVFFTLFAWQGLRMTYDLWLDPQPSVGFRELIPRFALAILLAAGSLVICRMVLVVASDLTCFVAQFTGMSLWGAIGVTFGSLMDGYTAWYQSLQRFSDNPFTYLLANFLLIFAFGLVVVIVMIFILFLFAKVLLAMLLRVALLAVLIALSPLAFAFLASDSTSHWTKKWVSMFLGATFQQVIVLIVIYLGVSMIGGSINEGVETGYSTMIVGMVISLATLMVANSVPGLINPAGSGMFSGFGQMAGMAGAGAMMVASGGVGAVAGLVAGGATGLSSAAGAMRGGGGGGQPPSGPTGPGNPPGGNQPPGGNPNTGQGLLSSISRAPMVSGGQQSGGTSPGGVTVSSVAPGGVAPGGAAPGGTAPGGTAPGGTAPGGTAPGGTAPGGTAPGGTAPGGTAPGGSVPGGVAVSGGVAPGGTDPGDPGVAVSGMVLGGATSTPSTPASGTPDSESSSSTGGSPAGRSSGSSGSRRPARNIFQRVADGAQTGMRVGSRMSGMAGGIASGRMFYSSSGPITASARHAAQDREREAEERQEAQAQQRLEREEQNELRQAEQSDERRQTRESYDSLTRAINRMTGVQDDDEE